MLGFVRSAPSGGDTTLHDSIGPSFLLLTPLAIGLAFAHAPGGAQTSTPPRRPGASRLPTHAPARTLDLHFDGLSRSPTASASCRFAAGLSIRYRMSLERITHLADSLRAPVDSVAPSCAARSSTRCRAGFSVAMTCPTPCYNVAQTTSNWSNSADWNLIRVPLFVRNTTIIGSTASRRADKVNLRQTRSALTDAAGSSPNNASIGARATSALHSQNPGNFNNEPNQSEYQISARTKYAPVRNLTSNCRFSRASLDVRNTSQVKRGGGRRFSRRRRATRSALAGPRCEGRASGNVARTGSDRDSAAHTRDVSNTVAARCRCSPRAVGLNVTYACGRAGGDPLDSTRIQQIRTESERRDHDPHAPRHDRYLNTPSGSGVSASASATNLSSLNRRGDQKLNLQGRYRFSIGPSTRRSTTATRTRIPATLGRRRVWATVRLALAPGTFHDRWIEVHLPSRGRVSLISRATTSSGSYLNPPVDRDQYRQSYSSTASTIVRGG